MQNQSRAILVRASADTDMATIAAIYAHHVRHGTASFETEPPSRQEMTSRRAAILCRGLPYLAAEQAGSVLGYAYAGPYRPRAAYRHTVEDSIYLRPDEIGRGIGGLLLAELIDQCTRLGLRQMVAVVGDSLHIASIRLHERFGFRLVGTLRSVGHKHGRWLDSVLLQRALGQGDATSPAAAPRTP